MPAAHHPPSPPDQPAQWFVFGGWVFDITAAAAIIRDEPRPTVSLPVAPWARAYGLDRDSGAGTIPLLGPGPRFDRAYAMTTDLTDPVIVATLPASAGPALPLLIDGYAPPVTVRSEAVAAVCRYPVTLGVSVGDPHAYAARRRCR